jgi:hypothetical protein
VGWPVGMWSWNHRKENALENSEDGNQHRLFETFLKTADIAYLPPFLFIEKSYRKIK